MQAQPTSHSGAGSHALAPSLSLLGQPPPFAPGLAPSRSGLGCAHLAAARVDFPGLRLPGVMGRRAPLRLASIQAAPATMGLPLGGLSNHKVNFAGASSIHLIGPLRQFLLYYFGLIVVPGGDDHVCHGLNKAFITTKETSQLCTICRGIAVHGSQ
jgi:hypothetical protein